ncbi:hypothetical protein J437_LFUL004303 [Ladona fulva]|uniref:MORN repeat-containing protein 3 n=1 Tax=Ladona fulva TaxID=123851 RepID=A0A8K0NWK6_LADFU|nr:hypothetical protein J437_LFUL004303 [Ladona fulva]
MVRGKKVKEPLWREWERLSLRNGLRRAIFSTNGDKYLGEWQNDVKGGKGFISDKNGWLYEGDWAGGLRHGHGVLSKMQKSGCRKILYIGGWYRGKKDGEGRELCDDGSIYQGHWANGMRNGEGQMWYNNGDYYEGEWKDNLPHNKGVLIYGIIQTPRTNGSIYEGEWLNGKKHGHGCYYHIRTGQMQQGLWINDISRCCEFSDAPFRNSAINPTQYPIQKIFLVDKAEVIQQAKEEIMENEGNLTTH